MQREQSDREMTKPVCGVNSTSLPFTKAARDRYIS